MQLLTHHNRKTSFGKSNEGSVFGSQSRAQVNGSFFSLNGNKPHEIWFHKQNYIVKGLCTAEFQCELHQIFPQSERCQSDSFMKSHKFVMILSSVAVILKDRY